MKKIIPVLMCGALIASMAAMTGCASSVSFNTSSTSTDTYNGISRTVTKNGDSKEEVVYTDENGNTMDQAKGEAAFKAAKAEVEGTEADTLNDVKDGETKTVTDATLNIVNDTDDDLTEMYFTDDSCENWGDNILHDGAVFTAGTEGSIGLNFYNPDASYKLDLVNSNGDEDEIDMISFSNVNNPKDITVTIEGGDGIYIVEVA